MTTREVNIEVKPREHGQGSAAARRIRRAGMIPGVVYGGGVTAEPVELDPRPVQALLKTEGGRNTLIHLRIGDRELRRMVMLREVQHDPITGRLTHADFARIEMNQKITVDVAVHAVGVPLGVKNEGGTLEVVHRTLRIKVLPTSIPPFIEVDVAALHAGQHIEASEVVLPAGADLAMPPGETIVTVLGKQAEEVAAPVEAPAAAAPTPEAKP